MVALVLDTFFPWPMAEADAWAAEGLGARHKAEATRKCIACANGELRLEAAPSCPVGSP